MLSPLEWGRFIHWTLISCVSCVENRDGHGLLWVLRKIHRYCVLLGRGMVYKLRILSKWGERMREVDLILFPLGWNCWNDGYTRFFPLQIWSIWVCYDILMIVMTWFGVREGICVGMDGLDMDGFDWLCIFESLVGLEIGGVLDWLCFSYSSVWFF